MNIDKLNVGEKLFLITVVSGELIYYPVVIYKIDKEANTFGLIDPDDDMIYNVIMDDNDLYFIEEHPEYLISTKIQDLKAHKISD